MVWRPMGCVRYFGFGEYNTVRLTELALSYPILDASTFLVIRYFCPIVIF